MHAAPQADARSYQRKLQRLDQKLPGAAAATGDEYGQLMQSGSTAAGEQDNAGMTPEYEINPPAPHDMD